MIKNNFKKIIFTAIFGIGLLATHASASAASYIVKNGDSIWKISNQFGVSGQLIKQQNTLSNSTIYPGQKLTIPSTITQSEKDLMARLVNAEAKGEPYAGKVAVATVILNRVDHPSFPNTVRNVIYQKSNGHYAFSPVANGEINKPATAAAYKAVKEAIAFRGQGKGSLYFYNPKTATSKWIFSKTVTITIGNHRFAK